MPSTMLSAPKQRITVVVVDDHYLIRRALHDMFATQDDMTLVGQGVVGADILPLVERYEPDVLLLDLAMSQESGNHSEKFQALPMIAQLRRRWPRMAIIILSAYLKPNIVRGAIELGVPGYVLKSDDLSRELLTAVRAVYHGDKAFSQTVLDSLAQTTKAEDEPNLTPRQIEVLTAMARMPDFQYADLARQLNISSSTLRKHLTNAYHALNVHSNKAAIMRFIELGFWVPADDE